MKTKEGPCSRSIRASKYEKTTTTNRDWWQELFNTIEADAAIPPDKRIAVLAKVFPTNMLSKILSILSIADLPFERAEKSSSLKTIHSRLNEESDSIVQEEIEKASASTIMSEKPKGNVAGPENPYLNFFKRRPDRAAVWRELPPLSLEEMNLTQKAEAITETIATSFVKWLKSLEGGEQSALDVPTVIKMFEIGFDTQAATSLRIRIREKPTVTEDIAVKRNVLWLSNTNCLFAQIERDKRAAKRKRRTVAFGQTLPRELRYIPPPSREAKRWLRCDHVPGDVVTMAAVWRDIAHLRCAVQLYGSTRAYCAWLLSHPDVVPPQYLRERGMISEEFVNEQRYSVDAQELTNVQLPPEMLEYSASDSKPNLTVLHREPSV